MRRIITPLLFCLAITKLAAQAATNNTLTLTVEPAGNSYLATAYNPQDCEVLVEGRLPSDTSFRIPAQGKVFTFLPAWRVEGKELSIRTKTKCSQPANSSWVSFTVIKPHVLFLREPVTYYVPKPDKNDIISLYSTSWQRVRTLRESDLPYTLKQLPPGRYFIRGAKSITQVCNKCLL